ncbi:hypothetical protein JKP88DRAFT_299052 [Tribonema minus]|uniref:Uncharacterized protein n=1 Tax=Tribonema minus TaxID=303371 RepID=A0A836CKX5_9STRA|nr:hypothetical protein JKP88DRAFT_299052 [Tribonema minus]
MQQPFRFFQPLLVALRRGGKHAQKVERITGQAGLVPRAGMSGFPLTLDNVEALLLVPLVELLATGTWQSKCAAAKVCAAAVYAFPGTFLDLPPGAIPGAPPSPPLSPRSGRGAPQSPSQRFASLRSQLSLRSLTSQPEDGEGVGEGGGGGTVMPLPSSRVPGMLGGLGAHALLLDMLAGGCGGVHQGGAALDALTALFEDPAVARLAVDDGAVQVLMPLLSGGGNGDSIVNSRRRQALMLLKCAMIVAPHVTPWAKPDVLACEHVIGYGQEAQQKVELFAHRQRVTDYLTVSAEHQAAFSDKQLCTYKAAFKKYDALCAGALGPADMAQLLQELHLKYRPPAGSPKGSPSSLLSRLSGGLDALEDRVLGGVQSPESGRKSPRSRAATPPHDAGAASLHSGQGGGGGPALAYKETSFDEFLDIVTANKHWWSSSPGGRAALLGSLRGAMGRNRVTTPRSDHD